MWEIEFEMKIRNVEIAAHILSMRSCESVTELIEILQYYNEGFDEAERVGAMLSGSTTLVRDDIAFEELIKKCLNHRVQKSYITSNKVVCGFCGK